MEYLCVRNLVGFNNPTGGSLMDGKFRGRALIAQSLFPALSFFGQFGFTG
jgi:hypothetical protein